MGYRKVELQRIKKGLRIGTLQPARFPLYSRKGLHSCAGYAIMIYGIR